jgi:internalin A
VTFDPTEWNRWNTDPAAAYDEAERRIERCAENRCEQLDLALKLERLPRGISSLTWLQELNLYGSPVHDYAPLEPLSDLTSLKLGSLHAPFPGLDFLSHWEGLKVLELISTTTLDLSPLRHCVGLERLGIHCSLHKVDVKNLSALSGCRNLAHVSLLNMQSDQYSTIADWSGLTFAQILGANLPSLDMFAGLTRLEYASVSGAPVADLLPLSGLPNLQRIDVSETDVRDLAPIARLPALEELSCNRTQVSDLEPLAELARFQMSNRQLAGAEYRPIRQLKDVALADCPVNDLAPLAHLDGLRRLDLSGTKVASLEPLHNNRSLWSLNISNTRIFDLGPEGSLANLGYLTAVNCPLESISALAPALGMQAVNLTGTSVADLRPLRRARSCRSLLFRHSLVKNLAPLLETGEYVDDFRNSPQQLDFRDTPAAAMSDELARLASVADEDLFKCFTETKSYLRAQASSSLLKRLTLKLRH